MNPVARAIFIAILILGTIALHHSSRPGVEAQKRYRECIERTDSTFDECLQLSRHE